MASDHARGVMLLSPDPCEGMTSQDRAIASSIVRTNNAEESIAAEKRKKERRLAEQAQRSSN